MTEGSISTFIVMVFIAVFLLAQGTIVPVFGESRKMRRLLSQRLQEIDDGSDDGGITSLMRERYLNNLTGWERWLEQLPFMESLRRTLEQSGYKIRAYRLVLLSAVLAAAGLMAAWLITRMSWLSVLAMVIAAGIPYVAVTRARAKRIAQIEEQLPDAIDVIRRALRAGHPFNSAIKLVAEDMDDPIAREFELTFSDINYGNDVRRAMLGLLSRVPSVTVMTLVTSVLVQKETGGNLADILAQIADVVRGRFRFQRKVMTLSAEGRMSAWVLGLVPMGMFVLISIANPDYMPMLLEDDTGKKIVMFAFVWGAIGILFIRRIIRIEV